MTYLHLENNKIKTSLFWYVLVCYFIHYNRTINAYIETTNYKETCFGSFFLQVFLGVGVCGLGFFFKFDTYPALIRVIRSGLCNTLHDQENKVTFPISYHVKV